MNKKQFIEQIYERGNFVEKKSAERIYDVFTGLIMETLSNGEKIRLAGFGTFEVVERSEREGRNPQTGDAIHISPSKAPKFRAGKAFKSALNEP